MRRFKALLWKEWIELRPFAALLGVLFCIGLIATFATEFVITNCSGSPVWSNTVISPG